MRWLLPIGRICWLCAAGVWAAAVLLQVGGCSSPGQTSWNVETQEPPYWPQPKPLWHEASYPELRAEIPTVADAEYINEDQFCAVCHEAFAQSFQQNLHHTVACEKCHGPASRHLETRGTEPTIRSFREKTKQVRMDPPQRSEVCLQCHEEKACEPGARWRTSTHAHHGVACTDCHTVHYNVPPGTPPTQLAGHPTPRDPAFQLTGQLAHTSQEPAEEESQAKMRAEARHLGAITPQICFRCHSGKQQLQQVAHAHQLCDAIGFDCKTCHDPHGKIRHETRTQLCLKCHKGTPTMAWHSSTHNLEGVACTDCHDPHPDTSVPGMVQISHTAVDRRPRLPMSVDEPFACYKCHPNVYAKNALPSHHPIKEGKMVCSDCHDAHGQAHGNLKESTVNLVCYRCHADKEGPFVWEHPPVTENCAICHEPHGTVANNLLHQPATFLCLRCHAGHRGRNTTIDADPTIRPAFYSDCTQCHAQVHGSDLPSLTRHRRLTR